MVGRSFGVNGSSRAENEYDSLRFYKAPNELVEVLFNKSATGCGFELPFEFDGAVGSGRCRNVSGRSRFAECSRK
jgi:hypothetical protein